MPQTRWEKKRREINSKQRRPRPQGTLRAWHVEESAIVDLSSLNVWLSQFLFLLYVCAPVASFFALHLFCCVVVLLWHFFVHNREQFICTYKYNSVCEHNTNKQRFCYYIKCVMHKNLENFAPSFAFVDRTNKRMTKNKQNELGEHNETEPFSNITSLLFIFHRTPSLLPVKQRKKCEKEPKEKNNNK